ncbi:MAG: HAMP domain-containing protein [Candidatus Latescibacteria bacterium]|nr:HAMP domain-containing protein [Candidatus Latescibacterota bacterium]
MKIRSKIAVALIPLLLLSVVAMSAFSKQAAQEVLIQGVINSGRAISLNLAQSPEMLQSFQQGEEKRLLPLLQQVQENSGARYAMILSLTGEVRAHTNVVERGKLYADEATLQAIGSDQSEYLRLMLDGQELMDLSFPIWEVEKNEAGEEFILTGKKEARAQKRLGTIRLGLPLQEALNTAGRISSQVFWIITLVSLGAVGLGMLFIGRLLRPISLLGEAADRIGKGGMGVTVPVLADDELGELARSFNQMSQELAVTTVSKDFLDSILRNMQDLLVVTDAGGIISLVNQSTLELLSYREEDLVGRPWRSSPGETRNSAARIWRSRSASWPAAARRVWSPAPGQRCRWSSAWDSWPARNGRWKASSSPPPTSPNARRPRTSSASRCRKRKCCSRRSTTG